MSWTEYYHGKVIWLIGASTGIGEALAKVLSQAKCTLVVSARREELLKKLAEDLSKGQATVSYRVVDVTDGAKVKAAADSIRAEFGRIDIAIANAGNHIPTDIKKFDVEEYRSIFEVNFFGVLNCFSAVLSDMLNKRSGQLVAVSSIAGYRGLPLSAAYGASKSALTHFCESIRHDLYETGVEVVVVSPGFVRTPLTDKNEFKMPFLMEPDDAAMEMATGIAARSLEVHFPKKFTCFLKFLRILPIGWYNFFIRKFV